MEIVQIATQIFSVLTILCQIGIVLLLISFIIKSKISTNIIAFFGRNALLFGFLIALVSMLGSLFYSEIAHYDPCKLCWYQRILMYPQVILLGMAYFRKDNSIINYSIVFSILGAGVALYHYLLQTGTVQEILPCAAVGYSVSCAEKFIMTFGYITIPMMALSGFLFITLLLLALKKYTSSKSTKLKS